MQPPVLDANTDKGKLEQDIILHRLLSVNTSKNAALCAAAAELLDKDEAEITETTLLMKLFALSCKAERDCRALEICSMMSNSQTVGRAIQYATSLKRMNLAKQVKNIIKILKKKEITNLIPMFTLNRIFIFISIII